MSGLRLVAVALCAAAVAGTAGAAGDPALKALRDRDAFVNARAVSDPAAEERLLSAAAEISARGPVKLVIATGPVGAPSMSAYARRLRRDLGFPGTLVVSAVGRPTAVAGPTDAEAMKALDAAGVDEIDDPVARTIAAADATVGRRSRKGLLLLLALGLLGGLWAVAIGMRRLRGEERDRAQRLRTVLDEAIDEIQRRGPDASEQVRARASASAAAIREAARHARSAEELGALIPQARDALAALPTPAESEIQARLAELAATISVDRPEASAS